jgi:5'-methylthioadenosine phosphorylase
MAKSIPSSLGILGGSGLYNMPEIRNAEWLYRESPFGEPSDHLLSGIIDNRSVKFIPRHGRTHRLSPSDINYRANIDVMKRSGCTELLSFSAVGSLREELSPGTFVIIDQFIDRTTQRACSFFGSGVVAHVGFSDPVCSRLGDIVEETARHLDIPYVRGGTYLVMEGPQFSTRAESFIHKSWGCSTIGMTGLPEAKLAREAELCYCCIAMITDYDCWHERYQAVSADHVAASMANISNNAQRLLAAIASSPDVHDPSCSCHFALDNAIMTAPEAYDAGMMKKLDAICARFNRSLPSAMKDEEELSS